MKHISWSFTADKVIFQCRNYGWWKTRYVVKFIPPLPTPLPLPFSQNIHSPICAKCAAKYYFLFWFPFERYSINKSGTIEGIYACTLYFYLSILFYPITLGGHRGTTDDFATIPFHLDLFSAALVELAKSIPVHSLILSSHLFFCLPLFLFPFTVPCRIVFAKPEDLETWPNHLSFRFLTRVRSSSYSPMAALIFLRTSSLVTWSLYEMFNSLL